MRPDPNLVTTLALPENPVETAVAVSLKPLAVWAVLALFFAGAAVLVALFGPARQPPGLEALAKDGTLQAADLVAAMDRLADDNRRLAQRIVGLERQLEVTGSAPKDAAAPRPGPAPAAAGQSASTAPGSDPVPTLRFAAPTGRAPTQTPGAAGKPEAADPVPRLDFAVDLGADTALDGLRLRWAALTSKHRVLLEGLEPRVGMREGTGGTAELRLIVGPLATAEAAARICAALAGQGATCQSAIYGGQRLSLR